ncbi:MAG: 50S ribosomal protein L35 [Patescibacteria group bacterium]
MKLKTKKAVAKRFVLKRGKGKKKLLKRTDGQDHFNARESGKTKRNKRSDNIMSPTVQQTLLRAMPYN